MQSTRQEKISRLLQKEFGDIFVHYGRQIQGVIISVSEVRITSASQIVENIPMKSTFFDGEVISTPIQVDKHIQ